jgi:glycosyltransferase involved in cell wall biosynthesis
MDVDTGNPYSKIPPNFTNYIKVLYIQPGTTSFAGIERVVDTVCSELGEKYKNCIDVSVLYTSIHTNRPQEPRAYRVIDRVTHSKVHLMQTYRSVIASDHYDLIIVPQIEPSVICMLACLGVQRKFAVYLHGNPHRERSHFKAKILFWMMKALFVGRVSYVFGTSPRQLASFKAMFNSKVGQAWLPNPVRRFDVRRSKPPEEKDFVTFVNVGRFSHQKGQDILLDAFVKVSELRRNVKLKIVGHGIGEAALRDHIKRSNLEELVRIEYYPDSPEPALAASDVYVSTSRWEGWSLAICEALRFGMPVISTDCEFGPSDILIDRRLGQLVPPEGGHELVTAMLYYCDNLFDEAQHSDYRKDYIARFDAERIVDVHAEALILAASGSEQL